MAAVSQWERKIIGQRTKEGVAQARAAGKQIGSPVRPQVEVEQRIVAASRQGLTVAAIAQRLNDDLVPLPGRGRIWCPASVSAALRRISNPAA